MEATSAAAREIAVPVEVFGHLRRELTAQAGPLATIRALHAAGYAAGHAAAEGFTRGLDRDVSSLGSGAFWRRLDAYFTRRGWGPLAHEPASDAVALLVSSTWSESEGAEPDAEGSCTFSTGFLAGLLSALSGGRVAVLEVECRIRGDDRCAFAFGSEQAVHDLYGRLLEGADLHGALTSL